MDMRPITVRLRELGTRDRLEAAARIEALEAALHTLYTSCTTHPDFRLDSHVMRIARAALAPEQDK